MKANELYKPVLHTPTVSYHFTTIFESVSFDGVTGLQNTAVH